MFYATVITETEKLDTTDASKDKCEYTSTGSMMKGRNCFQSCQCHQDITHVVYGGNVNYARQNRLEQTSEVVWRWIQRI